MFIDAKDRAIEITEGYSGVEAFHDDKQIGSIEFDEIETDYYHSYIRLSGMNVDSAYQKAGIGTEMMKLAAEIYGKDFSKPCFTAVGGSQAESHTYYTPEGAALIRRCIALDILLDTQDAYNDEYDELM
ncbi:GNAT family N-acetyltransferase [Acinetobacter johnsonii]|uniref:GNAT family N-acetyltransferase n=1 Tax=Acinetobacter johnsonii TaxID=40214 RepID=UPI0021697B52|nr:GNAT family N-acetyltransferase [Acinetobacter johnsonii]MCS3528630.1 GNAT superfamily N-acetyltransferase [Acinetobacter johnsonii]